ncbi:MULTISPECIES: MBOAT family O-acyltransferase [Azorhizobium]|uniref:Probable alginate O-acetylase AlgI n=1 Tax=Azorhizobium caulinodans (strain ATCC 43989 / DSM 5975 / JCM 20966 / LMG 6465 / NBRC 14845 / NCIMB 13405 / ORS 571) TaxID=438753 RepID=A8HUI9_AZOC5|nr:MULTISPECIES: MBOAT family O-acyltransferase [Azorhizobium]TDT92848.1 D-alanyl-lipoteichoic acid acyltransferase DltB (MBOAT superfamily) [Azorhizobium sp. AG788]BAF86950.1 putative alginate O-acetyltransferase [Azorhizobium caulinodans ORS 571]
MIFSSVTFLYYFLPAFLICYFAVPGVRAKNFVLLAFSLVFYGWGGFANVAVLAVSILMNYAMAMAIGRGTPRHRLRMLSLAVALNLAGLIVFKYSGFLAENINLLLPEALALPVVHLPLPLGISFFTFHAISYLVDVYRGRVRANGRLEEIVIYITMFPQLVAGPIVRYSTISRRIHDRRTTIGRVSAGLRIFVIGLSWKVLIADEVAPLASVVFDQTSQPGFIAAWLGVLAYALQIYFDFGGYSNMAIGLALAMGLKFPRNFRTPYGSQSITDFWRRWHMSLSSWFRDYVYIPLGGNRRGHLHTALNLWTVFLLCGLWHGASWTFVIWGAHHGAFLVLERTAFGRWLKRAPVVIAHAYTLLVVLTGWVWFRANDLANAADMFAGLAGLNGFEAPTTGLLQALQPLTIAMMILGWPLAMFGLPRPPRGLAAHPGRLKAYALGDSIAALALFILCVITVGAAAYSPFLYFRF